MAQMPPPSTGSAALRFHATGAAELSLPDAPLLQELLRYWQSKLKPDGRLPARTDLDPLELRSLLPSIYLIDVLPHESEGGRLRFRIRLLGERHVEVYGPGMAGKVIDDMFPPAVAHEFNRLYAAVVKRRLPVVNRGQVSWLQGKEWLQYEGLHAPLATDGHSIDCIFGAGAFIGLD